MKQNEKYFFLRIGSNSEKNYIYKTVPFFNAVIAKSNFYESSAGLLSSLFIKLNIQKKESSYIIDPNTYVFALDPMNQWSIRSWVKCKKSDALKKVIENLRLDQHENPSDAIREIENPKDRDIDKVEIFTIKNSFRKLSDKFFISKIANQVGKRALMADDFDNLETVRTFVSNVIRYQQTALSARFNAEKYKDLLIGILPPKFILSPYFAITDDSWYKAMNSIWQEFNNQYKEDDSAIVLLTNKDFFSANSKRLTEDIIKLQSTFVFLWISNFKEEVATEIELTNFVNFITLLHKNNKKVIDLYAGGLSTLLFPFGLAGITNGTGYGMDRDIEPVQGGLPTAQFYLPTLHIRQQVLESYNLIMINLIGTSKVDFHKNICNCPICREGIQSGAIDMLQYFGELGDYKKDKNGNKRRFPTPRAMERCNFHFILSRLLEYKWAKNASLEDINNKIDEEIHLWKKSNKHLVRWQKVLLKFMPSTN